jgi:PrtD family type I secretion system ABC transporter
MIMAKQERAGAKDIRKAFSGFGKVFWIIGIFSAVINLLALTGSLYMLQVYDRVLGSRSVETLIWLSIITISLYMFQGLLDVLRSRIMVRLGARLDEQLLGKVHKALVRMPLYGRAAEAGQPMRDLDTIRGFITSQGPLAIIDLPFMPLFLGFVFFLHPWLGWMATAGAFVLICLTLWTELSTRRPTKDAVKLANERQSLADAHRRNAEVLHAMGFAHRAYARFQKVNDKYLLTQEKVSDVGGALSGVSKVTRYLLQSALLGLGAYLVLKGEAFPGVIIASSIASTRALAPIELAIAQWKNFVAARQARTRLEEVLSMIGDDPIRTSLPAPRESISVEGVTAVAPGTQKIIVSNVTFDVPAGSACGIIGPSAAGKSTLARVMVGVWPMARGKIRLDGAALEQWDQETLGSHIGYLPQDVALFDGTIAENIARFEENPDDEAVVSAARAANVHDMILHLTDGYNTRIGDHGAALSGGQRQRIALARALYREPFLVVMDEPNANLDAEGEAAVTAAIESVRRRKGIAIVIAHRPSALAAVDLCAVMKDGAVAAFGPRDEVLSKMTRRPNTPQAPPPGPGQQVMAQQMMPQSAAADGMRRQPTPPPLQLIQNTDQPMEGTEKRPPAAE